MAYLGVSFALLTALGRFDPLTASELLRTPFVQATLFLAVFMLTDPPTAPSRMGDQLGTGVLVAVASGLAKILGAGQSYLLVGVLVGNVALAARRWINQQAQAVAAPAPRHKNARRRVPLTHNVV